MAARNRGSYSNSGRRGNGLAFVRGILIFGALAVLSFGFGFIVIARMLPMGTTNPSTIGTNAVSGVDNAKDHVANAGSVTPSTTLHSAESVAPQTHKAVNEPGPSIDPSAGDTKVQQPSSIDGDGQSNAPDPLKPDPTIGQPTQAIGSPAAEPSIDPNGIPIVTKHHRRHHRKTPNKDSVQPSAIVPDSSTDTVNSNGDSSTPDAAAPAPDSTSHLYRVQFGVFSTREAADDVAKQAGDKNLDASVQTYTQDGRTLYRVTHGLYRRKANADAAKQRLTDGGFEATISK